MITDELEAKIKKLPEGVLPQVEDYIDYLLNKYNNPGEVKTEEKEKFKFDWEGGLKHLKSKYTSVELQHKAMDWR